MTRRLFGTNGIRGVANVDLTPDLAQRVGRSVASWLPAGSAVGVGRDARTTGPMLAAAATSGLLASGARVVDLGIAPTPAIQYYVKSHEDVRAAVIVTASHNPPEFNGLKLVAADGTETSAEEEEAVERIYFEARFREVAWNDVAPVQEDPGTNSAYVGAIERLVDAKAIAARKFKIVVDTGGGPGGLTTPPLLRNLGCRVVTLHEALDGRFSGRKSEPTEENLGKLKQAVVAEGADLGVAHDGDADRCIFIDERGRYVGGEVSLALFAQDVFARRKGGVMCTPVSSSSLVEEVVRGAGGRVRWTAVGSPIVARTMMREEAALGGEENGGVIFPEHQYCRDAAMSAARMVELLARRGQPLSALVDALPKYFVTKLKFPVPEAQKSQTLDALRGWVRTTYPRARVDETDGLKVHLEDAWVLIRPSGTEPIYRVFAESKKEERAASLAQAFVEQGILLAR